MSVVNILDRVTDWARDNICSKIQLKMPPDDDRAATDAGYDYELVTPAAFTMYVPTRDKTPPGVKSPIPSICVRCREGEDSLIESRGSISMEFCFSAWNPGVYGADVLRPVEGAELEARRWTGPEANDHFQRYGGGYRDVWNFVDIALREIESTTHIDGIEIDRNTPVKYGPLTEQESIPDFYPLWFAWVTFTLTYPIVRNNTDIENLL